MRFLCENYCLFRIYIMWLLLKWLQSDSWIWAPLTTICGAIKIIHHIMKTANLPYSSNPLPSLSTSLLFQMLCIWSTRDNILYDFMCPRVLITPPRQASGPFACEVIPWAKYLENYRHVKLEKTSARLVYAEQEIIYGDDNLKSTFQSMQPLKLLSIRFSSWISNFNSSISIFFSL